MNRSLFVGDGTPGNPYRPAVADDYSLLSWYDLKGYEWRNGVTELQIITDAGTQAAIDADPAYQDLYPAPWTYPHPTFPDPAVRAEDTDLRDAILAMSEGDTLEISDGIHALDSMTWGPAGASTPSIIKAADGARPIIVDINGEAPNLTFNPYLKVQDLWLGGGLSSVESHFLFPKHDCVFSGLTLFGFPGAFDKATADRCQFVDCRFVKCSYIPYMHAIYLNDAAVTPGNGATVRGNMFIWGGDPSADGGVEFSIYHGEGYATVYNNLFADCYYGAYLSGGSYNVASKNILWWIYDQYCLLVSGTGSQANENIFGRRSTRLEGDGVGSGNVFLPTSNPRGGAANYYGDNPIFWSENDFENNLGVSPDELDQAIANIEASFAQSIEDLHDDITVETNFAIIKSVMDAWETL